MITPREIVNTMVVCVGTDAQKKFSSKFPRYLSVFHMLVLMKLSRGEVVYLNDYPTVGVSMRDKMGYAISVPSSKLAANGKVVLRLELTASGREAANRLESSLQEICDKVNNKTSPTV